MPKICRATEDSLSKAKRFTMEQSASFVLYRQVERQTEVCPVIQVTQTQRSRVVNLMCRIYVAGMGFDTREDTIRVAFSPFGPIRRVDMSWDSATQNKGFAFVEYEVPDSAELALDQMHDNMISGRPIKVTRPCNAPNTQAMIDGILDESRPFARIFVSNIHPQIHARDLRAVFETFGKLRSCVVIGERNPVHKGIAYLEFEDHTCANDAIVSMNRFMLGGQSLRVGKAVTLASHIPEDKGLPPAAALAMAAVSAKLQGRQNMPQKPKETALIKKTNQDSILNMPPMESLVSAIVSPAMVQAGLSDFAANIVNSVDVQSLIAPAAFKSRTESRRRAKNREKTKKSDETVSTQADSPKKDTPNDESLKQSPPTSDNIEKKKTEKRNKSITGEGEDKNVTDLKRDETRKGDVPLAKKRETLKDKYKSRHRRHSRSRSRRKYRSPGYACATKEEKEVIYPSRRRSRSRSKNGRKIGHSRPKATEPDNVDRRRRRSGSKRRIRDRRHDRRRDHSRSRHKSSEALQTTTLEDLSIKGGNARLLVMQKLARNLETNVLLMRNLVSSDQVDERLEQELHQECLQYGPIKQVLINQERQGEASDSPTVVKIFVQFKDSKHAEKAHSALNHRFFVGKPIRAELYDQEKFENKDFSGSL